MLLKDLRQLKSGVVEENEEKAKSFKNNNRLKGVHEIKSFKVRTIYRIIDRNTILVLMVKMKKSNNDRKDLVEVINRADKTWNEFDDIYNRRNDDSFISSLVNENDILYQDIIKQMEARVK